MTSVIFLLAILGSAALGLSACDDDDLAITVLLYRHAMIHAKTAKIDGQWSIVGTANIDRLSLGFNYETNLEIHDRDVAADMEAVFAADSENCRELTADRWDERSPAAWFAETVLVPLRPFL